MSSKDSKSSAGTKLALFGSIVAAAAGAFYVYSNSDEAKKHIKKMKGWVLKAKGEVVHKLEHLKAVDEEIYNKVVDSVMKKYEKVKNVDASELAATIKEMKGHWNKIKKEVVGVKAVAKKTAKSAVKVAKKATKAVTK